MSEPMERAALIDLKKWAWEQAGGWGTEAPTEGEGLPKFRPWTFTERRTKADELIAWALTAPEEEQKEL